MHICLLDYFCISNRKNCFKKVGVFFLHCFTDSLTHLCLLSATLSRSHTSWEWAERTTCTPHSCSSSRARSGPSVRASRRVRLSGLIRPSQFVEPLDQLLPFTSVASCGSATRQYCWESWISSFHSSRLWGSTPENVWNDQRHKCQTQGSWARSGPLRLFKRPSSF